MLRRPRKLPEDHTHRWQCHAAHDAGQGDTLPGIHTVLSQKAAAELHEVQESYLVFKTLLDLGHSPGLKTLLQQGSEPRGWRGGNFRMPISEEKGLEDQLIQEPHTQKCPQEPSG